MPGEPAQPAPIVLPHAPAPTEVAAHLSSHPVAHAAETGEPAETWGRVDPDGTVYVRTSEGEVSVGSFQAGSPVEALAYYTRKYDALAVEVDLLERRVSLPDVAPDESMTHPEARTGRARHAYLRRRHRGAAGALQALVRSHRRPPRAGPGGADQAKTEAKAVRERIVTDAEALADSVQWKVAGERLRELLDEWKTAPHVDRATEQAMWKRFGAAQELLRPAPPQHFAQLSAQQGVVKAAKQKLIAEAETLSTSTEWGPTASGCGSS